jgi:hypothetical protein
MVTVLHRRFQNRPAVWLISSVVLFFLAWLLPIDTKGDVEPLGYLWVVLLSGQWICDWSEWFIMLGTCTTVLAVSAAILGWIVHAFIVVGLNWRQAQHRVAAERISQADVGRDAV